MADFEVSYFFVPLGIITGTLEENLFIIGSNFEILVIIVSYMQFCNLRMINSLQNYNSH